LRVVALEQAAAAPFCSGQLADAGAVAEGRDAISLNGRMIDAANMPMAQTVVRRQQAIEAQERGTTA
jgi:citrate lyase beta subunit